MHVLVMIYVTFAALILPNLSRAKCLSNGETANKLYAQETMFESSYKSVH